MIDSSNQRCYNAVISHRFRQPPVLDFDNGWYYTIVLVTHITQEIKL